MIRMEAPIGAMYCSLCVMHLVLCRTAVLHLVARCVAQGGGRHLLYVCFSCHCSCLCQQAVMFPSRLCCALCFCSRVLHICGYMVRLLASSPLRPGCRCGLSSSSGCSAIAGPAAPPAADVHIVPPFCVPLFCSLTCWLSTPVRVTGSVWAVLAPAARTRHNTASHTCYGVQDLVWQVYHAVRGAKW
jgi:hypothetical protein